MSCCNGNSCGKGEEKGTEKGKSYKVVLIGDGGVGKTTLIQRHLVGKFVTGYVATLGLEVHPIIQDGICLNLWDCAGQEKFSGLKDGYFLGSDAAIIMFDLSNNLSAKNALIWYRALRRVCDTIPVLLVGNKSDCAKSFAPPVIKGAPYLEICVKTGENCESVFESVRQLVSGW